MPSVYIKTYGCQMNERDSEAVAAQLVSKGYSLARTEAVADVILLNTCSVRDMAEQKAINKMENLAGQIRKKRPEVVLGFLGCMAQSRGQQLIDQLPDVDLVLGTQKFHRAADYLDEILSGKRERIVDVAEEKGSEATVRDHILRGNTADKAVTAFVSIMQGCNQYCTFCIVPYTRGAERSRTIPDILAECRELVSRGVKEITLLGQIVTSYGKRFSAEELQDWLGGFLPAVSVDDTEGANGIMHPASMSHSNKPSGLVVGQASSLSAGLPARGLDSGAGCPDGRQDARPTIQRKSAFVQLLEAVHEIDGLERIRFTSPHPKGYGDDLVDAYARLPKLVESAHLPLQSGSDRLLKLMHRGYTRERFSRIIGNLRRARPNIGITTDIIVGFPGETKADFEETLSLAREIQFDNAYVFKYSQRKDTPAASMPNQIPAALIEERHSRLLTLINEIAAEKYERFVGQRVQILVEGESKKNSARMTGRTRCNKIVLFEGNDRHRGQLMDLKIQHTGSFTLYGDPAILGLD